MELLVTVIIIMVIAGYALFAYMESRHEADNARAKATLELINSGYERMMIERPATYTDITQPLTAAMYTGASCPAAGTGTLYQILIGCGYIPRIGFDNPGMNYEFTFSGGDPAEPGRFLMRAKAGREIGKFSLDSGYCATVDYTKGGRAVDGC